MKKFLILCCFFVSIGMHGQQQTVQNDSSGFWDHVRFGGGLGVGFGSNNTTLLVAPSAIYEFNEQIALGVGGSYLYAKNNNLKSNVYGASFLSLYNPIQEIQLSGEYEQLFVTQNLGSIKSNFNYPALYFGVAYRTGYFSVGIRYDVLYDETKNIYASPFSPIVRFYF